MMADAERCRSLITGEPRDCIQTQELEQAGNALGFAGLDPACHSCRVGPNGSETLHSTAMEISWPCERVNTQMSFWEGREPPSKCT